MPDRESYVFKQLINTCMFWFELVLAQRIPEEVHVSCPLNKSKIKFCSKGITIQLPILAKSAAAPAYSSFFSASLQTPLRRCYDLEELIWYCMLACICSGSDIIETALCFAPSKQVKFGYIPCSKGNTTWRCCCCVQS